MKALSTRHPSVSATVSEVIYASKSPWTEAFEKTSVTAGANEIKCIKKKKHKHDTYLLDGTFMLCYPCLHSRMTMWVSHPVAKYLFLLMLVWHFKTFFIGKIKSWGDWHWANTFSNFVVLYIWQTMQTSLRFFPSVSFCLPFFLNF